MNTQVAVLTLISLYSTGSMSQSSPETWRCRERADGPVLVVVAHDGGTKGTVQVAGVTQDAKYSVEGINRRWDFGPNIRRGVPRFVFAIRPNGSGEYVDFVEGHASRETFTCQAD
jgi:hypothetical protein